MSVDGSRSIADSTHDLAGYFWILNIYNILYMCMSTSNKLLVVPVSP